jgi:hypothetical protein
MNNEKGLAQSVHSETLFVGNSTGAKTQVFTGRGTVDAVYAVPDSGTGYVQVFDAASVGDVTLGTTIPKLTFPFSATSASPAKLEGSALAFMNLGCVVAVTTTSKGATLVPCALAVWGNKAG